MLRIRQVALALLPLLATASAPPLDAQAVADAPEPEEGAWAPTVVALLEKGHELCSDVAERATSYWSRLGGSQDAVQETLDEYMLTRATADLASAREALDIARRFLPRASREIDPRGGEVLDRLYEVQEALCNEVAQPRPPMAEFRARIEEAEGRIREVEAELGSTLPLDRKALAKQVEPYLEVIETIGAAARQEVMRDLEAAPPPPPPLASEQELMEAWHVRYTAAVVEAKMALGSYLQARESRDPGKIQAACKELLEVVIPLLTEEKDVFRAPDPEVEEPLSTVYKAMRRIGNRCTAGRFPDADDAYAWLKEKLNESARVLAPYGLQP